jgi:hypothetical protein
MNDSDLNRRRWEVFLDALETGLDQLSDRSRFPMIVPPPDHATLPADLAERANRVLARLGSAEAGIEASIERNWAEHPRPERVTRVERTAVSAALDVRA